MLEHHRRHFVPESTVLVAVGDFDPRGLISLVKSQFGAWPAGGKPFAPFPTVLESGRPRVRRIHRPGEQIQIVLGHLGIAAAGIRTSARS